MRGRQFQDKKFYIIKINPINMKDKIEYSDFEKVDIRVGEVLDVKPFPEGKYSTHILEINLGEELGKKKSLAKLAPNYQGKELIGKQVVCVVNFHPKQIGKHTSEVLTLGFPDENKNVVLIQPERKIPIGGKLY